MKHSLPPPAVHARRGAVSRGCLIAAVVIILPVLLIGGCAMGQYNGIVQKRERVDSAWSTVESDYKRRADLIPQLEATVKGAANFERSTLNEVTEARANATRMHVDVSDLDDPAKVEAYLKAQGELGSALGRLIATVENYPELKATQSFLTFQDQLEGTENRINTSRKDYVEAVRQFNTAVRTFPANLLAGMFNFEVLPQFKAEEKDTQVPVVDFSDGK